MHPSKTNVSHAHIVATPTLYAWSQAYNAGTLFAVLSLHVSEPTENLHAIGKELISTLEEEYFTLETKTLDAIKKAVNITWEKFPKKMTGCLAITAVINNISYLFTAGEGSIVLKRGEKIGVILVGNSEQTINSASGFLENGDMLILQTKQFASHISIQSLLAEIKKTTPAEIVEYVSPKIHEQEDGANAAVVLSYQEPAQKEEEPDIAAFSQDISLSSPKTNYIPRTNYIKLLLEKINFHTPQIPLRMNSSRKIMLFVAIILLSVLIGGIYISKKQQQEATLKASYKELTDSAEKKYEEGQALIELNKNLARDNFAKAQKILQEGKTKFPKDSSYTKQIDDLLKKIDDSLMTTAAVNNVRAKQVSDKDSNLLANEVKNISSETTFAQDTTTLYIASKTGIISIDKKTQKEKTLVKNTNTWASATGIGTYLGNLYLLDAEKNQLLKLAATQSGYGRANYLVSGVTIDFSKANSMAIDGSVWVLFTDGRIQKFTRGKPDAFTPSGLDSPLGKPVKIVTAADIDKIYVLDTAQSRIVVFNKNGAYHEQYQTKMLKKAVDLEVKEKEKKLLFLADGKIWQIDLK